MTQIEVLPRREKIMLTTIMLVACCLSADPTPPASPVNEELKTDIRRLVRKLDADQLAEREAAEQSLLDKGPPALDFLPEVDDKTTAEVRVRLTRVKQKFQQAMAEAAVKPSLITLKDDAMPFSKAIIAIGEQSGNKIEDHREKFGQPVTDPNVKVNFEKTPFWQALDDVLDQAGLTLYPFAEGAGLNVVAKGEKQLPLGKSASYAGPFRLLPTQAMATRELRTDAGASLNISIETAWEPRLKPIAIRQKMQDIEAVDDKGNALKIEGEADLEVPVDGSRSAVELMLPFVAPPRDVKEIASIKGKLSAIIPGKVETFQFDNLLKAKNVEKHIAGVTVTLEGVQQNNEAWEIRVLVKFDEAGDALASHRGWIFQNEAYLEGADGKPIAYDAFETTRQGKDEVGVAYIFSLEKPPEKMKFTYKTPAALFAPTFEYELKNIKLP
jgi:hypothetical protein